MTNKPKTKPKLLQIACLNIYIYSSLLLMLQILLQNTAPGNTGRPHSSVCCNILRDSIPYLSKAVLPSQKFGKTHIREVFELFRNSCEVLPSFWQFCILAVRVLGSELALPFLVQKRFPSFASRTTLRSMLNPFQRHNHFAYCCVHGS